MTEQLDTEAAIEAIAKLLHQRWKEEQLEQGMANHPYKTCRGKCDRQVFLHSDNMVPYSQLRNWVREQYRKTAQVMLAWLAENGYKVVKE